jgi:hypothetical protein
MKKTRFDLSASTLHIIGMVIMLMDHAWVTIAPNHAWLTWVGRIAFPIFAFLVAEGYRRTSNFKGYLGRMLLFAVLAEIPFNMINSGGRAFYPLHQNTLFTFVLALLLMRCIDKLREKFANKASLVMFGSGIMLVVGYLLGSFLFVDYYGAGVVTVLIFYFFCERKWWSFLLQAICLYYVNVEMLGGLTVPMELFGYSFELHQQALALLALIPIWLYRGRHGNGSVPFRFLCYFFYPFHLLLLVALQLLGVRL